MSWDIYLEINTGNKYIEIGDGFDCTYNLAPMFYKALELKEGLRGLNGMEADGAIGYLQHAINEMKSNKEEYEKLNPKNGWGNYQNAIELLEWLLFKCNEHPLVRIKII